MKKNNWLFLFLITIASACSFPSKEELKLKQYKVEGQKLYLTHCSNCHQADGKGLGKVYPPLNTSDYMANNIDKVLCIMRNGMKEEITVNGVTYNQLMPGIPELTDLEVAEIATYIYNSWGYEEGLIGVGSIENKKKNCD
ncbi:MAG: cytochrome c [Cyclobacteriaceae bacterium]|nr:cytochrome c [Cyclobacteriaceae bacterium]